MTFLTDTFARYAMKKFLGLGHTGNQKDPANEAEAIRQFLTAAEVTIESIPATAAPVANRILDCTNSTLGVATSRLNVVLDASSSGKSYFIQVPSSHNLLNYSNPLTGSFYLAGNRVSFILPKKFGPTWRPILYDNNTTEIPPLASQDWFLDDFGILTSEDNLSLTSATLACYVYVGDTVATSGATSLGRTFLFMGG